MLLTVYGARGSHPGPSGSSFGSNTSCFLLVAENETIVLDAGSGMLPLSSEVPAGPIHILLSHMHLDHVMGLAAFAPLYEAGREIHIYGEKRNGLTIQEQMDGLFHPPYWPIRLSDCQAELHFHAVQAGHEFPIGSLKIKPIRIPHPDTCTGYLISNGAKRLAYLLDCELAAADRQQLAGEIHGCDLAVMDGCFLPGEEVSGWGHSSWQECTAMAQLAGIGKCVVAHFSSRCSDDELNSEADKAGAKCVFAKEGMCLEI